MTSSLNVAVISRDKDVRLAAARAFDRAPSTWTVRLHESPPSDADVAVFGSDLRNEAGDELVFDPGTSEPIVDRIKQMSSTARSRAYVVTGAGRGVGVTSAALHLAAASSRNYSTCFFDVNERWDSSRRLGLDAGHLTWGDLSTGEDATTQKNAEAMRVALPVSGSFRAMLPPDSLEQDVLQRAFQAAEAEFERVIVDCSDPDTLGQVLPQAHSGILLVPLTVPAAHRGAEMLRRHADERWAIVLNRLGPGGETTRAEIHRILEHPSVLELPCSPSLRDAEDDARLLTSHWNRYVRKVATLLAALEGA